MLICCTVPSVRYHVHGPETYVGDVIQAALKEGINVETVLFDGGDYLDIGTPEDSVKAGNFARQHSHD